MPDLEVSKLPALAGSALQATDPLPLADLSASETKKITAKDLIQSGIALIDDGSIPASKFNYILPDQSVTVAKLADGAVSAVKLAANSSAVVGSSTPGSGSFIGQLSFNSSTGLLTIWDGGTWQPLKASGSVNTINADTTGTIRIAVTKTGDVVSLDAEPAPTTAAAQFLAGPVAAAGAVTARAITAADLPTAGVSTKGIVTVPAGQGVRVNGGPTGLGAALEIDNDVTASSTAQLVTFSSKGLVTGGRALNATDIPIATRTSVGGISSGTQFAVQPSGALEHTNSITPGTGIKVQFDAAGHIVGTVGLTAADIPSIDASKINTGYLNVARIAPQSIPKEALANYATTIIQEGDPGNGDYTGQFWYKESDAQLRTWSGNSWIPVGFGRLSAENLRFCGTFDAATGKVISVTAFGKSASLTAGGLIPAPSDSLTGAYLVAAVPGSFQGETYDNGDWTLCMGGGTGGTWSRIDTLNGGGGTTTIRLRDLLDLQISSKPASGDTLVYDALTATWVNKPTAAQKAKFVEAFDGVRTSFTLNKDANLSDELLMSLGGVLQEPDVDFSFTAPRTVDFATPPPAGLECWILVEGIASTGGGGGGGSGTTLPNGTGANEFLRWNSATAKWRPEVAALTTLDDVALSTPSQGDFLQRNGAGKWVNVSTFDEGTWT